MQPWQPPGNLQPIVRNWANNSPTPVSQTQRFFIHFLRATPAVIPTTVTAAVDEAEKMQVVEAVLLVAKDSLSSRKLAQVAGLADATEARTLVRLLNH
ncbi:MAG: hypothetical protein IT423_00970, partial [Pirellulaceae bacterium]|nr:hypothetical protein [Pirellulaceae bacterium]